jgi:thioredoxin reductase (NADPH)
MVKILIVYEKMQTEISGVYACGDVREKELKQVSTAVGDGAIAGVAAEKYLAESEILGQRVALLTKKLNP